MLNFEKHFEKIKKIKNISQYFKEENISKEKLNAFMKKKQNLMGFLFILTMFFAIIVLHHAASDKKEENRKVVIKPQALKNDAVPDGVLTNDFTSKNNLSALEQQQSQIDQLNKAVSKLTDSLKSGNSQNSLEHADGNENKIDQSSNLSKNQVGQNNQVNSEPFSNVTGSTVPSVKLAMQNSPQVQQSTSDSSFNSISFHYASKNQQKTNTQNNYAWNQNRHASPQIKRSASKNPSTWVPAGTFDRVVLLVGADANASVNGQSDTSPILMRFLGDGTLPNGYHSHLKGCFALASIYGDISSERGEARLNKISCTQKDGSILEMPVQGFISFAGKEGIRGTPVMRNGKILTMAGISGMLSGFGSALAQGSQTQSISPLGATTTVSPSQVWQSGAYTGASTAMGQLASYYIKRADQYHPVIDIGSGTVATVVFQTGFSLVPKSTRNQLQNVTSNSNNLTNQTSSNDSSEIKSLLKENQILSQEKAQSVQSQLSDNSNSSGDAMSAPFSNLSTQAGGVITNG